MITKITCRYSFEVLDFHWNDFGFTFNIGVSYLGIYKTSMIKADQKIFCFRSPGGGKNITRSVGKTFFDIDISIYFSLIY